MLRTLRIELGWLQERGACAPEVERFLVEFEPTGHSVEVTDDAEENERRLAHCSPEMLVNHAWLCSELGHLAGLGRATGWENHVTKRLGIDTLPCCRLDGRSDLRGVSQVLAVLVAAVLDREAES